MKIGELAKQSGIAASRIRFYEASGLLQPAERHANGYREYDPQTLMRLQVILRAQGVGFTLDEIRAILPPDLDEWPHEALLQALRSKLDEIEQLERKLKQNKRDLSALIAEIQDRKEGESCEGKTQATLEKMNRRRAG